ncbi:hypothetical protein MLD38_031219 [Melastoma candidum]|uniref:Uncharacterized protein n=1 Tax=Melastoma candidum TaxID=119954 RepID=A0ACB9MNM4_9MYRT|nr:hypothetical protein MLD38_031219 [Melastoma candidum]
MIQELLGTPTLINGQRRILPINGGIILEGTPNHPYPLLSPPFYPSLPSLVPPPSSAASTVPSALPGRVGATVDAPPTKNHSSNSSNSSSGSEHNQNLRCPRCDSLNTKFCYYNNYNLTQPRHFCKTCRRYWTKGGALRNVPIGGGCRKNKSSASSSSAVGSISSKSGGSKFKNLVSELGRPGLIPGLEHEILMPPNPVFWPAGSHNSNILSLLNGNTNPNRNTGMLPLPSFLPTKEEANILGSNFMPKPGFPGHPGSTMRSLGIEQLGHLHHNHPQQENCVTIHGEPQNYGMQSLFQRLRAPTGNNYFLENHGDLVTSGIQGNTGTSTPTTTSPISSSSLMLEAVPAATSDLGYWNPAFSMSDLPTNNGAYP